jgi:NADH-quinone oxidoreductase subunit J
MSSVIYTLLVFLLFFGFFVISSRNPIHSVLSLISVFLLSAILLICLEVEFLAFSFVIVYVGAIAILFLFVVMMLDIKIGDSSLDLLKYGPLSYCLGFAFVLEIILPFSNLTKTEYFHLFLDYSSLNWFAEIHTLSNIQSIGQILYTYYFVFFLISGLILFVAALGALSLTVVLNRYNKKQNVLK